MLVLYIILKNSSCAVSDISTSSNMKVTWLEEKVCFITDKPDRNVWLQHANKLADLPNTLNQMTHKQWCCRIQHKMNYYKM